MPRGPTVSSYVAPPTALLDLTAAPSSPFSCTDRIVRSLIASPAYEPIGPTGSPVVAGTVPSVSSGTEAGGMGVGGGHNSQGSLKTVEEEEMGKDGEKKTDANKMSK